MCRFLDLHFVDQDPDPQLPWDESLKTSIATSTKVIVNPVVDLMTLVLV